jgi:hypothetical protein
VRFAGVQVCILTQVAWALSAHAWSALVALPESALPELLELHPAASTESAYGRTAQVAAAARTPIDSAKL